MNKNQDKIPHTDKTWTHTGPGRFSDNVSSQNNKPNQKPVDDHATKSPGPFYRETNEQIDKQHNYPEDSVNENSDQTPESQPIGKDYAIDQ